MERTGKDNKKKRVVQRKNARDLRKVSPPLNRHLSADQHIVCMRKVLKAGKEPLKRVMPEDRTGPGIVLVSNGQNEKSHNSRGISERYKEVSFLNIRENKTRLNTTLVLPN